MDLKVVDEMVRVDDKECFLMTRELVRQEGLFVGGSSGAAVAGAIKYAEASGRKESILVLLPDGAQKYLSKIFDDKWMRENGFLDEPDPLGTVAQLLRSKQQRPLVTARRGDKIRDVISKMRDSGISQMPVLDEHGRLAGIIAEVDLLNFLLESPGEGGRNLDSPIDDLVESDYATVTSSTRVHLLRNIFNDAKMVVVDDGDAVVGVITKIDLIEYLAARR
jgi:cystathionine beta-synthase